MAGELHTFVFADLAGFTALTEAHGDDHAADLAVAFYARAQELLLACEGQQLKQLGDGVLLRVDDAAHAIELAATIVKEAAGRHGALGIRVGMNTGTAVERDGDWFGAAINLAARVAAGALRGEVLLTKATRDAAAEHLRDRTVQPRGRQRFRNVREPVELWALLVEPDKAESGLPLDPVCRMAVDPSLSAHRLEHRGLTYHFCSDRCFAAFRADPAHYVDQQHTDAR